jgi:hypothetical protein
VAPAAYKAINDAYYGELLKAPAAARSRAQAGYAIAAAIATALVTAGVLTDFEERQALVKFLALFAVAGWIATALIFMLAVSVGVRPIKRGQHLDAEEFVGAVTTNVTHEVNEVNSSIHKGWISALVASGLTLLTLIVAFALPKPKQPTEIQALIRLSPLGRTNVGQLCGSAISPSGVVVTLDESSLGTSRASFMIPADLCQAAMAAGKDELTVRLPTRQILAYAQVG